MRYLLTFQIFRTFIFRGSKNGSRQNCRPFYQSRSCWSFHCMGGCTPAPCPLNYHSRQFPDSSRRIFSEFPRSSFCSLLFHCFVVASSRFPHGFQSVPAAPICHGLRCPTAESRLRSCRSFHGSNIHKLQPVKTLGGSPFEKSAVYIKAACPRFLTVYSQK